LGIGAGGDDGKPDGADAVSLAFTDAAVYGSDAAATLALTFSGDISGFATGDITLEGEEAGVVKGDLLGGGEGNYTLALSGTGVPAGIAVRVGKSGYDISPESRIARVYRGVPVEGAAGTGSIKGKFGIGAEGKDAVEAAFSELHAYIQNGGLAKYPDAIRLGDWIDLEGGLAVDAYNDTGGFSHDAEKAVEEVKNQGQPWGTLCRLIVVGINSFNTVNGNNMPHVVFQFQNIPVIRRMNATNTNEGGYAASEMRTYLAGNFLAGLKNAGVPENVLWAPERVLSAGIDGTGAVTISDKLWLPTERELFQDGKSLIYIGYDINNTFILGPFSANGETAGNQARLEYYTDNNIRRKTWCGDLAIRNNYYPDMESGYGWMYWTGSSDEFYSGFCVVTGEGISSGSTSAHGVAPAFCVK
jgi:hypothetical protein